MQRQIIGVLAGILLGGSVALAVDPVVAQVQNDRKAEADRLLQQGIQQYQISQFWEALQSWEQALAIYREIGDRAGEGAALNNLGNVYENLGEYPRAIELFEQALVIAREIGDRAGEGAALGNLGIVYYLLGQYPRAIELYEQQLVITREIGDRAGEGRALNNLGASLFASGQASQAEVSLLQAATILESLRASELPDQNRLNFFDTQQRTYRLLQKVLIVQNKISDALAVAERSRARILLESAAPNFALPPTLNPSSLPTWSELQGIAQQQRITLVQYSIIEFTNDQDDPVLYIWVIQPSGELHFREVPLTNLSDSLTNLSDSLSTLIQNTRNSLGTRGRGFVIDEPSTDPTANLQELHQLLIDPIAELLPTNPEEQVVFLPQGELFLVPFPALQDANGQYLIEKHTILTAPSIQTLGLTQQAQPINPRSLQPDDLLIVGNPTMPAVWNPNTATTEPLAALPGAETEARTIADYFQTQALTAAQATETAISDRIGQAKVIHLATHGLLDYGSPQDSGVLDIPGAIALAPTDSDDGLLTAAELLVLKLNANLVVLSACDTGLGRLTGDGVNGLSRSLIVAGAPSVIVSLWSVPDAPTAELMTEFYRQWQQNGLDKAQALRQAMLTTLKTHPDPKDWAAFTLVGSSR